MKKVTRLPDLMVPNRWKGEKERRNEILETTSKYCTYLPRSEYLGKYPLLTCTLHTPGVNTGILDNIPSHMNCTVDTQKNLIDKERKGKVK